MSANASTATVATGAAGGFVGELADSL